MERIKWLRKQRDGYIVGVYRNILCHIYQEINSVSINKKHCKLQDLVKEDSIYYRTNEQVMELCDTLYELGYIDKINHNDIMEFTILKPMDF